jgi:hypothetical protein
MPKDIEKRKDTKRKDKKPLLKDSPTPDTPCLEMKFPCTEQEWAALRQELASTYNTFVTRSETKQQQAPAGVAAKTLLPVKEETNRKKQRHK